MLIGYFDYAIIIILIFLNIKFWKRDVVGCLAILAGIFLFGLVLPIVSMLVEINRVERTIGIIDSFEVLYTYLRFPTYWIIGTIQAVVSTLKWSFRSLAH